MSTEISISINKNKKKFKPKVGKRKRTNEPPAHEEEEHNTNHEEKKPAETIEPLPNVIQPNKQDYQEEQIISPELFQELIHLYPRTVRKATNSFKRAPPKDYIPSDLPTAEDRRKKSNMIQEPLLNELQRRIEKTNRERKIREQGNDLTESVLAPQVKIVKGKIVLDEDTLEISRSDPNYIDMATDTLMENQDVAIKSQWTPLETQVFYDGLSIYGTDFTSIADTLVGRNRNSVALKYRREEALYPEKVAKYLFKKPTEE